MTLSPLHLAALASAAVTKLAPVTVRPLPWEGETQAVVITESTSSTWLVLVPGTPTERTQLEAESAALKVFDSPSRRELPFDLPEIAGQIITDDGELVIVYRYAPGEALEAEDLAPDSPIPARIGRSLAAVHNLKPSVITDKGLPSYTTEDIRNRLLREFDAVAESSGVPPQLLSRWENAIEDTSLWKFSPVAIHGSMGVDVFWANNGTIGSITGWENLHIGDPAEDLSWIVATGDERFIKTVFDAYGTLRKDSPDLGILPRASLLSEFAVARWLMEGVHLDDQEIIEDAKYMLDGLLENIENGNLRPLSITPDEPAASEDGQQNTVADVETSVNTPESEVSAPSENAEAALTEQHGVTPAHSVADPADSTPSSPVTDNLVQIRPASEQTKTSTADPQDSPATSVTPFAKKSRDTDGKDQPSKTPTPTTNDPLNDTVILAPANTAEKNPQGQESDSENSQDQPAVSPKLSSVESLPSAASEKTETTTESPITEPVRLISKKNSSDQKKN